MLNKKTKERIIKKFKIHETDTGSSPVQIAILTEEIRELVEHLKEHKKDFSSRRGLLKKVNERRRLLRYLERNDPIGFETIAKKLKLKIAKKEDKAKVLLEEEPYLKVPEEPGEKELSEEEKI